MKNFVKYLLKAQIASDSGNGFMSSYSQNNEKACLRNYKVKDLYISQAIAKAKKISSKVKVTRGFDSNIGMNVIYFDIAGFGQVSFHTFSKFSKVRNEGVWNGIRGGSIRTCEALAKAYKLKY